jgi:uncharacterized protein with ACT and thioredoxin-like domain
MTIDDTGATIKKNSSKRSARVPHLSDEEWTRLELLAKRLKVIHDGKPSIPGLIREIARGRFVVSSALELLERHDDISHDSLIELDIEVISDANGVMALIAKKISDVQGNIYFAKTEEQKHRKIIKIKLLVNEELYLLDLIKAIKDIKFSDIVEFNNSEQLIRVAISLSQHYYDLGINENFASLMIRNELYKYKKENNLDAFSNIKIVSNVVLTVGLKIKVRNKPGVLMKLSDWISKKYIPMKSVDVYPCSNKQDSQIHVYIGITSDMVDSFKHVGSIEKMISDLKKETFVINVERVENI